MNRNTNPPILYDTEQESSNSAQGQKGEKVGCPRCKAIVPDAPFCCQCGRALHRRQNPKRRGNGQGTVVKRGDKWRAVVGLLYKYAIPRQYAERNLAEYLKINAEVGKHLEGFAVDEVNLIRDSVGIVDGADVILCMIYTGFRPSEFLSLKGENYDPERQTLTGGAKTKAGKNRIVTISPKIAHLIPHRPPDAFLWDVPHDPNNFIDRFFYPTLERIGIDNPMIDGRHRLTPHSCRHTFATLMKRVPGADRDKMELIGHASGEMLRYYQDVGIEDLRKITDQI